MTESQYKAENFDENGEFIRDPRYMVSEEVASRNIVQPEEEKPPQKFHLNYMGKSYTTVAASAEAAIAKIKAAVDGPPEGERDPIQERRESNQRRQQDLAAAFGTLASNPVGRPRKDPQQVGQYSPGRVGAPGPNEDWVIANQARDRGVDINTGAKMSQRLGQGLASYKDPQLRYNMLDSHYRQKLADDGIPWPDTVPVAMYEKQTGRIAYVRGITEDDVASGDTPENVGRTRLTLVDPVGFNPADMAEYLPAISLAALEVAGGIGAGMIGTATASPQAAIFANMAFSSIINGVAAPVRNKLLKEYYDVTDEELEKYSNPDEALEQAIFAGGVELGMGQALTLARWVKGTGSKRVLTEGDYTELTDELDKINKLNAEFKAATGETIENPVMFVEAAAKRSDTVTGQSISTLSENLKRFLPNKVKRMLANSNDVTRFKLARAWRTVTNNATEEIGHGARVGLDDNGLLIPRGDVTEAAEEILKLAEKEYGVTAARQNLLDGKDEAERLFNKVHDTVSNAHYKDVQKITTHDVQLAVGNEEVQWNYWKSMIEPNATGTANGIHIVNGPNSPIRRALGHLSAEAKTNLSRSMGDRTQGFVEAAAKRSDTVTGQSISTSTI
jgi:hypothetical protein